MVLKSFSRLDKNYYRNRTSFSLFLILLSTALLFTHPIKAKATENRAKQVFIEQSLNGRAEKITFIDRNKILYTRGNGKSETVSLEKVKKNDKELYVGAATSRDELIIIERKGAGLLVTTANPQAKKPKARIFADASLKPSKKEAGVHAEPRRDASFIATQDFLTSYPFWSSKIVLGVYETLPEKHRNVIGLFPYLRADLTLRACAAGKAGAGVFELLNGQGTDCATLQKKWDALEKKGKIKTFKEKAETERKQARDIIACSQGMVGENFCRAAGKKLAERATDPKTVLDILS